MEVIVGIVVLVGMGMLVARHFRMKKAMIEGVSDQICVACDSRNVTGIGPNAYRCNDCGYEGGSGLAAQHEQRRQESILSLDPEERRASGIQDLREARTLLAAVDGTIAHALSASRYDIAGLRNVAFNDGHESSEKHQQLTSAMTDVLRAQQHIKDSALKLGQGTRYVKEYDIDFSAASFSLDIQFDNIFFDLKVHGKIKELRRYAREMHAAVADALNKIEGHRD